MLQFETKILDVRDTSFQRKRLIRYLYINKFRGLFNTPVHRVLFNFNQKIEVNISISSSLMHFK